jgi:hypothetical protein
MHRIGRTPLDTIIQHLGTIASNVELPLPVPIIAMATLCFLRTAVVTCLAIGWGSLRSIGPSWSPSIRSGVSRLPN